MKKFVSLAALALTLAIVATPKPAEASFTPRLNARANAERVPRPTTRTINTMGRNYWARNARLRWGFQNTLVDIEQKKDEIAPEFAAQPAPNYNTVPQDFTPYHTPRTRRYNRIFHFDSLFQRGTAAKTGQGFLGQPGLVEKEEYRNNIEVDAGGR